MVIMIGMLYAAIFAVVMFITVFQPYTVYNNSDLIAGKSDGSANKINYKVSTHDGITTVTCKKMTGMDTIWKYQADEDRTLQMHYDLNVTNGKAKLVLITPDDTITPPGRAGQCRTSARDDSVLRHRPPIRRIHNGIKSEKGSEPNQNRL